MDTNGRRVPDIGSERGSLPMVMLVAIIIGGVVIALFTTVTTGSDTARRDRDFQSAVQVADAGLQQAFALLRDMEAGETQAPCDTNDDGTCSGTLDAGDSYVWEYALAPGSSTQWEVTSRGTSGGSTRVLSANLGPRQLFPVAMLAKTTLTYNGGGNADNEFSVGSFGSITLNGNANDNVGSIVQYGPGPHNISVHSSFDGEIENAPNWTVAELDAIADEAFADPDHCGPGTTRPFYDVYPASVAAAGETPGVRGQVYCVGKVEFTHSSDHILTGPAGETVTIYVQNAGGDALHLVTQAHANWDRSTGQPGDPEELVIFVESGPVKFGSNQWSRFSGGIFAPNSTCSATGNQFIMGSIVCNDITVGGTFNYGTGLLGLTEGPFTMNSYWEDSASS